MSLSPRHLGASLALAALLVTGCSRHARVDLDLGPILFSRSLGAAPAAGDTVSGTSAPADVRSIRVVSYNIRFNERMELAGEELATFPELRDADVYLLQEVDLDGTRRLADRLGCGYVYDAVAYHPKSAHGFWGNAILSPHPLGDAWSEALPGNRRVTYRRMVGATIEHPSGPLVVVSVHAETSIFNLVPWGGGQADQWRFVADRAVAHAVAGAPIVVGGDFNSAPLLPLLFPTTGDLDEIFAIRGFVRLTPGDAPTGRGHGHRLDHLYGAGLDGGARPDTGTTATSPVIDSGVVDTARASDHFPVWTRFRTPGPSTG